MQTSNKIFNKGFTLIELLVVVAIIGLLSSVVLASLNSARAKARDAKRMSEIAEIQKAIEFYYDKYGQYPPVGQMLEDKVAIANNCSLNNPKFSQYLSEWLSTSPSDNLQISACGYVYDGFHHDANCVDHSPNYGGYIIMSFNAELSETVAKGDGVKCYSGAIPTSHVYCKGNYPPDSCKT